MGEMKDFEKGKWKKESLCKGKMGEMKDVEKENGRASKQRCNIGAGGSLSFNHIDLILSPAMTRI